MFWFLKKRPQVNIVELGVVEDPRDKKEKEKDYQAEEVAMAFPIEWKEKSEAEWRKFPIFYQDLSSSCVAQAVAKALGIENWLEEEKFVHFSARDIYTRRKNAPGKGMWFQDAMRIGHEHGATIEQLMPSQGINEMAMNVTEDRTPLTEFVSRPGRGGNYIHLPRDIDAIASIIEGTKKGIVLGFRFGRGEWNKPVPVIKSKVRYHHGVCATNAFLYKGKKALLIEDSWGVGSGIEGRRIITEDWFKNNRVSAACYYEFLKNEGIVKKLQYRFEKDLYYGMRNNEDVKKLQECLAHLKFFPDNVDFTGNFFGITLKSVKNFQTHYKITPVSGYVGRITRAKLNDLFA